MIKSKFSESQIIKILSRQESGQLIADICREYGISQGTFYPWRSKYSGMGTLQLNQLKEMEKESAQSKKLLPNRLSRSRVLKDVIED